MEGKDIVRRVRRKLVVQTWDRRVAYGRDSGGSRCLWWEGPVNSGGPRRRLCGFKSPLGSTSTALPRRAFICLERLTRLSTRATLPTHQNTHNTGRVTLMVVVNPSAPATCRELVL